MTANGLQLTKVLIFALFRSQRDWENIHFLAIENYLVQQRCKLAARTIRKRETAMLSLTYLIGDKKVLQSKRPQAKSSQKSKW